MEQIFPVKVYSPAKCVLSCDAQSIVLPAIDGEIGILPGHNDLVCLLGTGIMQVNTGTHHEMFMISGGALEVTGGAVSIYGLMVEKPADLDRAQILATSKEKQAALAKTNAYASNFETLTLELARCSAQLELLDKSGHKG